MSKKLVDSRKQYNPRFHKKTGQILCQCGCGQYFIATWITRPPAYFDEIHHKAALAKRKAEQRAARRAEESGNVKTE